MSKGLHQSQYIKHAQPQVQWQNRCSLIPTLIAERQGCEALELPGNIWETGKEAECLIFYACDSCLSSNTRTPTSLQGLSFELLCARGRKPPFRAGSGLLLSLRQQPRLHQTSQCFQIIVQRFQIKGRSRYYLNCSSGLTLSQSQAVKILLSSSMSNTGRRRVCPVKRVMGVTWSSCASD